MGISKRLQNPRPELRPVNAEKDCAYCTGKYYCAIAGRGFFIDEKYEPCEKYRDTREEHEKETALIAKNKKLQQIKIPAPRPEGAAKDCLYCKRLGEGMLFHRSGGTRQGETKTCYHYNEVNVRPVEEPQKCIYCLTNYHCSRGRVLRDGQPCEQYKEYPVEKTNPQIV